MASRHDGASISSFLQDIENARQEPQDAAPPREQNEVPITLIQDGMGSRFHVVTDAIENERISQLRTVFVSPSVPSLDPEALLDSMYFDVAATCLKDDRETQNYWEVEWNNSESTIPLASALTRLDWVLDDLTGEPTGFRETEIDNGDAIFNDYFQTSSSLQRKHGTRDDFVRGSSRNVPFRPGGLDQTTKDTTRNDTFDVSSFPQTAQSIWAELDGPIDSMLIQVPGVSSIASLGSQSTGNVIAYRNVLEDQQDEQEMENARTVHDEHHRLAEQHQPRAHTHTGGGAEEFDSDTIGFVKMAKTAEDKPATAAAAAATASGGFKLRFSNVFESDDEEEEDEEEETVESKEGAEAEKQVSSETTPASTTDAMVAPSAANTTETEHGAEDIDALLVADLKQLSTDFPRKSPPKEWAVMEEMDVSNWSELVPNMAFNYPFELDVFQKRAIYRLEQNQCVFVAAHTSAGKTVVAEYAIALAKKHMTRAIYTSPIKALSNQKFREFKKVFGDVGLITGDVSINPEASCLIVTTEILRSMLYRGADLIRDIEWVIFDEVHYVNDIDRGVVWEEVIIMLPQHVGLIALSATVPNTIEFAEWIGRTKKKKVYVMGTNKRPVPLQHYLYATGKLFRVVDAAGVYQHEGYKQAMLAVKPPQEKGKAPIPQYRDADSRAKFEKQQFSTLLEFLRKRELLPVVVFAFSKRKCEDIAYGLTKTDLTAGDEKSEIHVFIQNSLERLRPPDRMVPQILRIKDLLKRGIGVHHGGLLPIVKEIVEILFSRGLVKVLFATETFAMGVNMPARTVVFSGTRKHDGRAFRDLAPGEYIQMSGRAGRRGLDPHGTVIVMCQEDEVPEERSLHVMLMGKPQRLESQFRLTYNMILNLLRVEDMKVEDMMKRSFSEFNSQKNLPLAQAKLLLWEKKLSKMTDIECLFGEPAMEDYHAMATEIRQINRELHETISKSKQSNTFMGPGRVLIMSNKTHVNVYAVILKVVTDQTDKSHVAETIRSFTCLAIFSPDVLQYRNNTKPAHLEAGTKPISGISSGIAYELIQVKPHDIMILTKEKVKGDFAALLGPPVPSNPRELRLQKEQSQTADPSMAISNIVQQLQRLQEKYGPEGPPALHPLQDMKINEIDFVENYTRKQSLVSRLAQSKCHNCPKRDEQFSTVDKEKRLKAQIAYVKRELSDEKLQLMPDFQQRLMVLRELRYIDHENTVLLKGRVACEINASDELMLTELIFDNTFADLAPEEIAPVLTAFIFEEKGADEPQLTERLQQVREKMASLAHKLAEIQRDAGLDISPVEYVQKMKFGMMEVVFEWCRGMPFAEICQLTNIQEGSIVRCITRLEEACREVRNAARIIGDTTLYKKMEEASVMIKRDIVFASSLYVA